MTAVRARSRIADWVTGARTIASKNAFSVQKSKKHLKSELRVPRMMSQDDRREHSCQWLALTAAFPQTSFLPLLFSLKSASVLSEFKWVCVASSNLFLVSLFTVWRSGHGKELSSPSRCGSFYSFSRSNRGHASSENSLCEKVQKIQMQ